MSKLTRCIANKKILTTSSRGNQARKEESVSLKRNVRKNELGLGEIVNAVLAKNTALPTKNSLSAMVSTSDGRMAVGCWTGGVDIFSTDGQHQQDTVQGC